MNKMNVKKILLSGGIIWIVGIISTFLTCGWLFNWVYFIEPIIWQPAEVIMSAGNTVGSFALGLMGAIIFALVYAFVHKGLPYKGVKRGLVYGLIIWSVGALSGMITMPFFMTISWVVIIYWIVQALIMSLINGAIVGKVYKEKK